jgi:hypothetical protein
MQRACHECGKALDRVKPAWSDGEPVTRGRRASQRFCSVACARIYRVEMLKLTAPPATAAEVAQIRQRRHARPAKLRRIATERRAWEETVAAKDAEVVAQLRLWYTAEVAPKLGNMPRIDIVRALGVSPSYARNMATRAMVPHQRHFGALAELVGITMPRRLA